jgi:hypothetical protein
VQAAEARIEAGEGQDPAARNERVPTPTWRTRCSGRVVFVSWGACSAAQASSALCPASGRAASQRCWSLARALGRILLPMASGDDAVPNCSNQSRAAREVLHTYMTTVSQFTLGD